MRPKSQKRLFYDPESSGKITFTLVWKIKPKIIDCKPQKWHLNLNWTFLTWASHHTEQLKKISQQSASVLLLWTSILLCRRTRKHLVWKNWSLTLHLACPSDATQRVDNFICLRLIFPYFVSQLLLTKSMRGKNYCVPAPHSTHQWSYCSVLLVHILCMEHKLFIPFHPILPHPTPSCPISSYLSLSPQHLAMLHYSRKGSRNILPHNKLFSQRVERMTCSPSQSLQRAWDEEDREFAICSLSMMGITANSPYLLEWHF